MTDMHFGVNLDKTHKEKSVFVVVIFIHIVEPIIRNKYTKIVVRIATVRF